MRRNPGRPWRRPEGNRCRRKTVYRLAVRNSGERPATLPGKRADGGLVARVHVGPFVAVHFHGNKKLLMIAASCGIFVAFAVDHVAPVAPDGADVEQDRLVLGARPGEGFLAPFVPVDRLMRGRAQIRARGIFQLIFRGSGIARPLKKCVTLCGCRSFVFNEIR